MGRECLTEKGLRFCQRIALSPDVFVDYNPGGKTDVLKISLSTATSKGRCLYSPCPVLPSQPHFEMRMNSFEISHRTISMAFLSHNNSWSSFIH